MKTPSDADTPQPLTAEELDSRIAAQLVEAERASAEMPDWARCNRDAETVGPVHVNDGSAHDRAMAWSEGHSEGHTAGFEEGRASAELDELADRFDAVAANADPALGLSGTLVAKTWRAAAAAVRALAETLRTPV